MSDTPKSFEELFRFHYEIVKPLYSGMQSQGVMPIEILHELHAAYDHVTRYWQYGEAETEVVKKAYSHLKRSCLDAYKLRLIEILDYAKELGRVDLHLIDNGNFQKAHNSLLVELKKTAQLARQAEGKPEVLGEDPVPAYKLWSKTYDLCEQYETEFYLNKNIEWANQTTKSASKLEWSSNFWVGLVTGLISSGIITFVYHLCS